MSTQLQDKVLQFNFDLQATTRNFISVIFGTLMLEMEDVTAGKTDQIGETIGNIGELLKGKFTADDLPVDNRDWLSCFLFNSLDLVISLDHMNGNIEKMVGEKIALPTDKLRKEIAEIINF